MNHGFACRKDAYGQPPCKQWCGRVDLCLSTLTYPEDYMQSAYEHGKRDGSATAALNLIEARMRQHEREANDPTNVEAYRRRAKARYGEARAIYEAILALGEAAGDAQRLDWLHSWNEVLLETWFENSRIVHKVSRHGHVVGTGSTLREAIDAARGVPASPAPSGARDRIAPLLNAFGELHWRSGRGHDVSHEQIADAFEAIIAAADGVEVPRG